MGLNLLPPGVLTLCAAAAPAPSAVGSTFTFSDAFAEPAPLTPGSSDGGALDAGWDLVWTNFPASTLLLLTDGRVMCQSENDRAWWALTPDPQGSYVNGTWAPLAPMSTPRLYYASAVLRDGRVVIVGGEYTGGTTATDVNTAEIYDPVADAWSPLVTPGWGSIGDAPCAVLPDGRLLLGAIKSNVSAVWDPLTDAWGSAQPMLASSANEDSWVLLPTGDVVTVDCKRTQQSELWSNGSWVESGALPVNVVESSSAEIGPAMLLGDGRVLFFGATGHTVFYTPAPTAGQIGTWVAGPDLPLDSTGAQVVAKDAPAVLLPNGHVLLVAAPEGPSGWGTVASFYDVDPTVSPVAITAVAAPSNALYPYAGRFMLLPTGEVMYATGDYGVAFLPGVAPALPAPTLSAPPSAAVAGTTFQLTGTGLNGISQTVAYGDDASAATNYPLVRLVDLATGRVAYARTHDHSSMGVATGTAAETTQVTLPPLAPGTYQLVAVANGIPSAPATLQITNPCGGCLDSAGTCQVGDTLGACGPPYGACAACGQNRTCRSGVCACLGCLDWTSTCQPGTSLQACGAAGGTCLPCAVNEACVNGVCRGATGSSTSGSGTTTATGTTSSSSTSVSGSTSSSTSSTTSSSSPSSTSSTSSSSALSMTAAAASAAETTGHGGGPEPSTSSSTGDSKAPLTATGVGCGCTSAGEASAAVLAVLATMRLGRRRPRARRPR